jgi:AcrR family transcriptional regulator
MKKRNYRMSQRAESQKETRERIVDAAIALHEEIGPAATTISALAERAGVQRLTVYRHFASEDEILNACSTKWFGLHLPPDPAGFPITGDSDERTRAILRAVYRYYRDTQGMWRSLYHDREQLASLDAPMRQFDDYLAAVEENLLAVRPGRRTRRLRATVAHALRFSTWRSLAEQELSDNAMADLVGAWISACET